MSMSPLHTEGKYVKDSSGKTVYLRGTVSNTLWNPTSSNWNPTSSNGTVLRNAIAITPPCLGTPVPTLTVDSTPRGIPFTLEAI